MYKPMITVSLLFTTLFTTGFMWTQNRQGPVVSLGQGEMHLEWTPGLEAIVHIAAESEDALERIRIFRPDGRELFDLDARDRAPNGLSSLAAELREPDLERLLENYTEGRYEILAATVGGSLALGHANLSFDLPSAPHVVHPSPEQRVQASSLTVSWLPDRDVAGYELQLEQGEEDGFRVRLPPEQSTFPVPPGILAPATETSLELAAIGTNGNRTLVHVNFMTQP